MKLRFLGMQNLRNSGIATSNQDHATTTLVTRPLEEQLATSYLSVIMDNQEQMVPGVNTGTILCMCCITCGVACTMCCVTKISCQFEWRG